jgi:hypothetical protein
MPTAGAAGHDTVGKAVSMLLEHRYLALPVDPTGAIWVYSPRAGCSD